MMIDFGARARLQHRLFQSPRADTVPALVQVHGYCQPLILDGGASLGHAQR